MAAEIARVLLARHHACGLLGGDRAKGVSEEVSVGVGAPLEDMAWNGELYANVDVPLVEAVGLDAVHVDQLKELLEHDLTVGLVGEVEGVAAFGPTVLDLKDRDAEIATGREAAAEVSSKVGEFVLRNIDSAESVVAGAVECLTASDVVGRRPMSDVLTQDIANGGANGGFVDVLEFFLREPWIAVGLIPLDKEHAHLRAHTGLSKADVGNLVRRHFVYFSLWNTMNEVEAVKGGYVQHTFGAVQSRVR